MARRMLETAIANKKKGRITNEQAAALATLSGEKMTGKQVGATLAGDGTTEQKKAVNRVMKFAAHVATDSED